MSTKTSAPAHAPGPWKIVSQGRDRYIGNGEILTGEQYDAMTGKKSSYSEPNQFAKAFGFDAELNEANARRIVAAVNACEGIPTEALESGLIKELLAKAS